MKKFVIHGLRENDLKDCVWITRNKNESMDVLPRNFEFTVERNDLGQGRSHKDDFY